MLFVQQDHVSPSGPLGEAFADRGFEVSSQVVVPAERFQSPAVTVDLPDPAAFDAIVPMGAPWSVYDEATIGSWVHDEIAFLRAAYRIGVPVLGICFGGQALASAVGGAVVPAQQVEIGWTTVRTARPDLVSRGPWFQWHADRWVLPSGVKAFASTDVAEQAFVTGRSMGVQFHPELTPAMLEGWLGNGGDVHARGHGVDPDSLRRATATHAEAAQDRARSLVYAFLDQVARQPAPVTS